MAIFISGIITGVAVITGLGLVIAGNPVMDEWQKASCNDSEILKRYTHD